MKTLLRLWFLKSKANIRNLFKKPTSAIFTVCMVLLYGFIIISMFTIKRSPSPMMVTLDLHTSILVLIGFLALMLFSTLMSVSYTHLLKRIILHLIMLIPQQVNVVVIH